VIVVQLLGGLGNQLFQYALGRALSERRGLQLKLDLSSFKDYPLRSYRLGNFRIQAEIASEEGILQCGYGQGLIGMAQKNWDRTHPWYARRIVREESFRFSKDIFKVRDKTLIKGYWQSEKYFIDIAQELRDEIVLKSKMSEESLAILAEIRSGESVSLHVRRGDYVENPVTNAYHGVCSQDYYRRAIGIVKKKVKTETQYFVFSDDPDWVEKSLDIGTDFRTIRHNGLGKDYEDLMLMSACSNHVIANSSFSWWGAWLCKNPGKVVVAPCQWFAQAGKDTRDLLPKNWLTC
jgi:hypothetical protein